MKKNIWAMALVLALMACGQDEPRLEPRKPQVEEPQKGKDEKKDTANEKPADPKGETPKDEQNPETPQPEAPKPQNPQPEQPQPEQPQPEEPKDRPTDFYIGTRLQVGWRVQPAVYLGVLDLEKLLVYHQADDITIERLKPYLSIYSTDTSGKQYWLTDEELKQVQIVEVRYVDHQFGNGSITFKTRYKSFLSTSRHSLPFDRNAFFATKVKLNPEFHGKWYMRGVAKHIDLFYGDAIKYDESLYAAELDEQSVDYSDSDNSIRFTLELKHLATGRDLARIPVKLDQFKSLKNLKQDLFISNDYELLGIMRKKLERYKPGGDLVQLVNLGITNWIKHTNLGIRQGERAANMLHWETVGIQGGIVDVLVPDSQTKRDLDVYLESPKFSVLEAILVDRHLELKIKLEYVNNQALEGIVMPLTLRGIRQ